MDVLKTKEEIKNWLDEMRIEKYHINEDLTVNVDDRVDLDNKNLSEIPVKFGIINGSFYCDCNNLTSLKGCPKVVKGDFDCSYNKLKSLEYSPREIDGNFNCSCNKLKSLEGCSEIVNRNFNCEYNTNLTYEYLENFNFSFVKGKIYTDYANINKIEIINKYKIPSEENPYNKNFVSISKFTCKTKDIHNNTICFNLLTDIISTDKESNLITIHNDYRYVTCYIDKICRYTELKDMNDVLLFEKDRIKNMCTQEYFIINYIEGKYVAILEPNNKNIGYGAIIIPLFELLQEGTCMFYNENNKE